MSERSTAVSISGTVTPVYCEDVHYEFGPFRLYPASCVLLRDGVRVAITSKALELLLLLIERRGETVPKNELRAACGGSSTAVEENNLNQCASAVRRTLGERRGQHEYILTVTGVGYRFIAPVHFAPASITAMETAPEINNAPARHVWTPGVHFAWLAPLLALAAAGLVLYRRDRAAAYAPSNRRSIAVLGFKDITGTSAGHAWLSTALSEMLTMDLAQGGQLRTVPVDRVSNLKRDLGLSDTDGLTRAALQRIRGMASVDWVIVGAYTALESSNGGEIRLDIRVQDARTGDTVATVSAPGTERSLFDLADRAAAELREALRLSAAGAPPSRLPSSPGAMQLYAEGLDQLRASNPIAARQTLERAVAADPSNPFAYSALAAAWEALGYERKAKDSAQRGYQLASHLSVTERLEIQGRFLLYSQQWNEAIRVYRNLCRMQPDSLDAALMLVAAERDSAQPQDALATAEDLRRLPAPLRDDPRIDFAEAQVMDDLGDFRRAREYAIAAERKALSLGAHLFYARARLFESHTMQKLGLAQAAAVREEARGLCAALGDQSCVLQALRVSANELVLRPPHEPRAAQQLYEQGLVIARQIGSIGETLNLLQGLAVAFECESDFPAAEKPLQEALATARDAGSTRGVTSVQINLTDVYLFEGKLAEAESTARQAVASARSAGAQEYLGNALSKFARVLEMEGHANAARNAAEESVRVLRSTGEVNGRTDALTILGDCLLQTDNIELARGAYEEARTLRGGLATDVGIANALLDDGQLQAAQATAAHAIQSSHNQQDVHEETLSRAILIRALLAQGKIADALQTVQQEPGRFPDEYARLMFGIAAAHAQAASGQAGNVSSQLTT